MTGSAKDCEGFAIYSRVPSVLYCITGSAKHGEGFANLYITTSESQVCFTIVCFAFILCLYRCHKQIVPVLEDSGNRQYF